MDTISSCAFCNLESQSSRTIKVGEFCTSIVSSPWFRYGQCLVIPNRHIELMSELSDSESSEIMRELGRLSGLLDSGYGIGIVQKHQPQQPENGIKMRHLHFHVFPRIEQDALFPTPIPNSFEAFYTPSTEEVTKLLGILQ